MTNKAFADGKAPNKLKPYPRKFPLFVIATASSELYQERRSLPRQSQQVHHRMLMPRP